LTAFHDVQLLREPLGHPTRLDILFDLVACPQANRYKYLSPTRQIHVKIFSDVQFRITPLTDRNAAEMVQGIKGYRLVTEYRGHPAVDLKAIEEVLLRISHLAEAVPEISELDLNPIFALPEGQGCRIADARIRVVTSTLKLRVIRHIDRIDFT